MEGFKVAKTGMESNLELLLHFQNSVLGYIMGNALLSHEDIYIEIKDLFKILG
jgi:hypothetical protein